MITAVHWVTGPPEAGLTGVIATPAGFQSAAPAPSADKWTATVEAAADTTLSYKYDLGGTWSGVEETAGCGYVSNRSMSVTGGAVADTVAAWAGAGGC